jgi:hypothetical protein
VILYIILVSAFFGWGLFRQTRERRRHPSSKEPLLNVADNSETDEKLLLEVVLITFIMCPVLSDIVHPSHFLLGWLLCSVLCGVSLSALNYMVPNLISCILQSYYVQLLAGTINSLMLTCGVLSWS